MIKLKSEILNLHLQQSQIFIHHDAFLILFNSVFRYFNKQKVAAAVILHPLNLFQQN